jgi:hypothetical protein
MRWSTLAWALPRLIDEEAWQEIMGYIGAVLGPRLVERGFDVVGLDCGFYRDGWLYNDDHPRPLTFTQDVRRITSKDVEGFDAVVSWTRKRDSWLRWSPAPRKRRWRGSRT